MCDNFWLQTRKIKQNVLFNLDGFGSELCTAHVFTMFQGIYEILLLLFRYLMRKLNNGTNIYSGGLCNTGQVWIWWELSFPNQWHSIFLDINVNPLIWIMIINKVQTNGTHISSDKT